MADLRELYQEMILDHGRHPRNFGTLASANRSQQGYNPLCGDKITLYLELRENVLHDLSFQGSGCAIAIASASLLTETLKGKTISEMEEIFSLFQKLVTGETLSAEKKLAKLMVLAGVAEFPVRVKCATLAWHTLKAAIANVDQLVTTESTES